MEGTSGDGLGYPTSIFPKDFDQKFLCNHCNRILRDPVQSFCGHRFCRNCITSVVQSGEQVQCKSCIQEGVEDEQFSMLKMDQLFPDNAVKREMASMHTCCENEGCSWDGPFKQYEKHIKECNFRPVQCSQCHQPVIASKIQDHEKNECPKRQTKCKYCEMAIYAGDLNSHNDVCVKAPQKCPHCGKKKIARDMLETHINSECANYKLQCPAGCDPIDRSKFNTHLEQKTGFHMSFLLDRVMRLENAVQNGITSSSSQESINIMNAAIGDLQQKLGHLGDKIQSMSGGNSGNATSSQGAGVNDTDIQTIRTRCQVLELKTGTFEGIVTTLHREIERCITCLETLDRNRRADQEKMAANEQKMKQLERTIALKDIAIAEQDLRLQSLEMISYDGSLIWKVTEWSKKRENALKGTVTSIYSPAFYTSRTGYKMCARLYPNGDGMGKGTNLSIFFVVMKGHYDALLAWPFTQRVTFMLIDQNNRDHVVDSFRPDPNSSSFKRPTSEMNIASGCPLFMSLSKFDDPNTAYVKDDVMFVKISTDMSEIRRPIASSGTGGAST